MYLSKTVLQKYLTAKSLTCHYIFSTNANTLEVELLPLMTAVMMSVYYLFHMTIVILCGNFAINILLPPLFISI